MSRLKILLISYYFPPLGGAGVSRPLALFKNLPHYDIDVDVLTVKNISYRTYEPELLKGLQTERIYRTGSLDPQRIMYLLGMRKIKEKTISKGRSLIDNFFPDSKIGWVKQAVKVGRVLAENKKYDLILSTSPPISTHLIGKKLSKEFSIPYIADFRDYWTSYKPENWFTNNRDIQKAKELLAEICDSATDVTTVSEPIQEYLSKGKVIYNSYDETRALLWNSSPDKSCFYIGVLGTLDKLCPIEPLCQLLDTYREQNFESFQKIKVIQVGNINDPFFDNTLEKYKLTEIFEINNQKNRVETIELLNKTSMLYLGLNPNYEDGIVTTRLFDMIASGRAIIASVSENSEIARILRDIPNSICYTGAEISNAVEFVHNKIKSYKEEAEKIIPIPKAILPYSSNKMAEYFSVLIKELVLNYKRS